MKLKPVVWLSLLVCALVLGVTACKSSDPGSREFIPGKGWTPVD